MLRSCRCELLWPVINTAGVTQMSGVITVTMSFPTRVLRVISQQDDPTRTTAYGQLNSTLARIASVLKWEEGNSVIKKQRADHQPFECL